MSTQTLEDLYNEGLEIIRDNKLHQVTEPDHVPYELMDDYQQEIFHYYYQVDSYLKKNKIVDKWSDKVIDRFKTYPNGAKFEIEFTEGSPDEITEQEKMFERVAYLEKFISSQSNEKTTKNEILKYELQLNDKELRIIANNDINLVLYVFRVGATYDIFKKAFMSTEYIDKSNNLNEYMRTLINRKYLKQFISIDMHSIKIVKTGYIKADELEKLKDNKTIQKNTLIYTELSY